MNFFRHRSGGRDAFLGALFALLLVGAYAGASSIYSWSSGEVLTHSQLNANFAHIHNNMVGGHGARLVDADVSASAAISRSKIYAGSGMALAWAKVGAGTTACSSGTCTVDDNYGVSGATHTGTAGNYSVVLSPVMSDSTYGIILTSQTDDRFCTGAASAASTVVVQCRDSGGAAQNAVFTIVVYDT